MTDGIRIQRGGSPDGLRSIIGFQPPLVEDHAWVVQDAVEDFRKIRYYGDFIGQDGKIIRRTPDEGEPYTELKTRPLQLDDDRAESVGHDLVPELVQYIALVLEEHSDVPVTVDNIPKRLSAGKTLFNGIMKIWWEEGLEPEPEPSPPILQRIAE